MEQIAHIATINLKIKMQCLRKKCRKTFFSFNFISPIYFAAITANREALNEKTKQTKV